MSDPVAWIMIESGWEVVDADGTGVGKVEEVVGDRDIFSGLGISTGVFGSARWVPADDVAEITEGRVRLSLRGDQIRRLEEFASPPEPA